jgi:aminoglycoside phosphotransferase (APT) family kinase protein
MPTVSPAERTSIYDSLNACLAKLHGFNIVDLNLENFGRPGNYMARSLERWSKQYAASKLVEIPDMEWLASALKERLPNVERTSLVHGDYGLYNVIIHPDKPEVRAILDWEVSTLGDPLADLAWHTRPWWDYPDREGGSATSLVSLSLSTLGIPTMDQYVERYCERAGLRSFENRSFYIGYSQFRYAAIMQGIIKRARDGVASNRTMLHTQERVALIAAMARNTLEAG